MKLPFTKMEGCGNDYVYIDGIAHDFPIERARELAMLWSDRHLGIGADGLIVLVRDSDGLLRMLMWNADGSRGAMCGNGLRCVARFAESNGYTSGSSFVILTDSGPREVELLTTGSGDVLAQIGQVTCKPVSSIEISSRRYDFICGEAGNPHAVTFVDDVETAEVERIGTALQAHAAFPEGVNVEFVQVLSDNRMKQRTFERGTGETLACGTGAAFATAAARQVGHIHGHLTYVVLRGGTLTVVGDGASLAIVGPVRSVFAGEVNLPR